MTINMWIATVAWCCLAVGLLLRRQRRYHIPCMCLGMGLDLSLVLYLQFTRDAAQKALAFDLPLMHQLHIWSSTSALLLYFPVIYLGYRLVNGGGADIRVKHRYCAITAFVLRTLGFLFMFTLLKS